MNSIQKNLLNVRRMGQGKPVVLVHGVAGSGLIWEPVARILAKKYEVIMPDLLGYGYSPKPDVMYTPSTHVNAIRRTLKAEGVTEPFVLVGLSMGSLLALEYANRWPDEVQKLVCTGIPFFRSKKEAHMGVCQNFWIRVTLHWGLLGRSIVAVVWGLGRRSRWVSSKLTPTYNADVTRESMMNTYPVFKSTLLHCMIDNHAPALLAKSDRPILFVHGDKDKWADVSVTVNAIKAYPMATLVLLKDIPHNTVVFAPRETAEAIKSYIEG